MDNSEVKYSVIIPTYNGLGYLESCIDSVLDQKGDNFEVIISDDHSTDGTYEYLMSLQDRRIRITQPEFSASMTENWEWASLQASGEWQIFVGQDDALQDYFFELAEILTNLAEKKGVRTISSKRAYYFWNDCRHLYRNHIFDFYGTNGASILNMRYQSLRALSGIISYFELPHMYTSSIFHKSVIQDVRTKQSGKLFTSHPQDANLAAIASSLEDKFLYSRIPLGWVGSSNKSAGHAITNSNISAADDVKELRAEYLTKIQKSKLSYDARAGAFELDNLSLYFWQSVLSTHSIRTASKNRFFNSMWIKNMVLGSAYNSIRTKNADGLDLRPRLEEFKSLVLLNNTNLLSIKFFSSFVNAFRILDFLVLGVKKIGRTLSLGSQSESISMTITEDSKTDLSIMEVSKMVASRVRQTAWFIEKKE
jgi:glycosyltransferase involved in cell wall biosynthesis